jgi:mono/diheme cytochrome c family protein
MRLERLAVLAARVSTKQRDAGIFAALMAIAVAAGWDLAPGTRADDVMTNPVLGKADAIEAGRDIYRSKCLVCHASAGGRGPNLFASRLSDEGFLEVTINGRKGTQMPAFGLRLSPDEVWQVHAFVKSTDHY